MNLLLLNLLKTYLYGNIHIAFIASVCFFLYNWRLKQALIVGLCTFFYYNLCSISYIKNYEVTTNNERLAWVSRHLTELIFAMIGSAVFILFFITRSNYYIKSTVDAIAVCGCFSLCLTYFYLRHFKYVKNFTIACTWILTMHLWQNRDASWVDVFLILFITCVSIRYDKTESILKKALIDSLIILPFLANFFAEKYWIENSLKP